jgi:hypothetical protein
MTEREIMKLVDDLVGSRPTNAVVILEALSDAAGNTEEHIRTDWQDPHTGKPWGVFAYKCDQLAAWASGKLPI